MQQQPPQMSPIDRRIGYLADLKVVKRTFSVDEGPKPIMSPANVVVGFSARSLPSTTPVTTATASAAAGAGTTDTPPSDGEITLIMDGPGGFYGPSFSDPAPWACGGAPTPGCLPPPSAAIGGRR